MDQAQDRQIADSVQRLLPATGRQGSTPTAGCRADSCCALLTGRSAPDLYSEPASGQSHCWEDVATMQAGIVLPIKP